MKILLVLSLLTFIDRGSCSNHDLVLKSNTTRTYLNTNDVTIRLKGIHCSTSNFTSINVRCGIRPYSRTVAVLNIGLTYIRPLFKFYVRFLIVLECFLHHLILFIDEFLVRLQVWNPLS